MSKETWLLVPFVIIYRLRKRGVKLIDINSDTVLV